MHAGVAIRLLAASIVVKWLRYLDSNEDHDIQSVGSYLLDDISVAPVPGYCNVVTAGYGRNPPYT